jgi:hypothetical protein
MRGYKGFNDKLQCVLNGKAFQYEVGQTYTHNGPTDLCSKGFHFCEHPMDTWSYYAPFADTRYAEIEADEVSCETQEDPKRVSRSLTVKAEIKIPALIKAAVEFVFSKVKSSPTVSATTGYSAHSATTGDYAHSATTGNSAHSATTGYSAHSATTGYYAHSATTGNSAHSATTGNYAHSATTGDYAQASVKGNQCIAASLGAEGQAKGAKGNWIVLSEWEDGKIKAMGIAQIDGKKIEADTFYRLVNGKFTKVA